MEQNLQTHTSVRICVPESPRCAPETNTVSPPHFSEKEEFFKKGYFNPGRKKLTGEKRLFHDGR